MNVHTQQLYLLELRSESFEIWLASIMINTEDKSLSMTLGPELLFKSVHLSMYGSMTFFKCNTTLNMTLYSV